MSIKIRAIWIQSFSLFSPASLYLGPSMLPLHLLRLLWQCPLETWPKQPLFFLFLFFFFNLILFNFTILYWFCHISKWIRHRYTRVPHPETSSLLPPHTIPLGCPSAPAPSIQYRASDLDWRLISYMILYMFQCHSPKSSHPLFKKLNKIWDLVLQISRLVPQ